MSKSLIWLGFLATFSLAPLACGGGGGGGVENSTAPLSAATNAEVGRDCTGAAPLTPLLETTWAETEECTDLSAVPPKVIFSPTVECPRNHQQECLATVPFFPCSSDPSQSCGAIGRFLPECGAVELPDHYSGGAAHEMIHYLLYTSGRSDWAAHAAPEWVCQ